MDRDIEVRTGDNVHKSCRRSLTKRPLSDLLPAHQPNSNRPSTRSCSSEGSFCLKKNCVYCGEQFSDHPRDQGDIHDVKTFDFTRSINEAIAERKLDDWAIQVNYLFLQVDWIIGLDNMNLAYNKVFRGHTYRL